MVKVGGETHVSAPIGTVWEYVTRTDEDGAISMLLGGRAINTEPMGPQLDQGMKLNFTLESVGIHGLIVARIDRLNDEEHRFDASIVKAPLGVKGGAFVGLTEMNDADTSGTQLRFGLSLPFYAAPVAPVIQRGIDESMPNIGRSISQRLDRE